MRAAGLSALTLREREIFCRVIRGQETKDIAAKLGLSYKTVETHRAHIAKKVGSSKAIDLVLAAGLLAARAPLHAQDPFWEDLS